MKRTDEERGINQPMIRIFPVSSLGLAAPRPTDRPPASLAHSFLILSLFTPHLTPLRLRWLILAIFGSRLIRIVSDFLTTLDSLCLSLGVFLITHFRLYTSVQFVYRVVRSS